MQAVDVRTRRPSPSLQAVPALPRAGDAVLADDGFVGRIDQVVCTEDGVLAYLVVATGWVLRRRYPVVASPLVVGVDRSRGLIRLLASCEAIKRLPETLPAA
jgi:hypothetical protein